MFNIILNIFYILTTLGLYNKRHFKKRKEKISSLDVEYNIMEKIHFTRILHIKHTYTTQICMKK